MREVYQLVHGVLIEMSSEFEWDGVLAAYGEIAIKSDVVRRRFVKKLMNNIAVGLNDLDVEFKIRHRWSRIIVNTSSVSEALNLIRKIFGVVYASPFKFVYLNGLKDFIKLHSSELLGDVESFAVRVRRTGTHPFTSLELERELGSIVKEKTNLKVSLDNPDKTLFVEVRGDECYVFTDKFRGPGGLPLGTAGKVVCLISGGIDSPVAAWLMMRRGCSIIPLFAYFPRGGDESDLKRFIEVVKILRKWHIGEDMPVYIYKHEHNLIAFRRVALKYTCVLCRRMMYRVANELAKRIGAKAIVTGENLAQVASQTLYNLRVIDQASELPVLRPMIGFNKDESIELAKRIGTYEVSCMRVASGCTPIKGCWARPPKPVTKANLEDVLEFESKLNIEDLLNRSVESIRCLPDSYFKAS